MYKFVFLLAVVTAVEPTPQKHVWIRWGLNNNVNTVHKTVLPFGYDHHNEYRKVRGLSLDPDIFYIDNFITYEEAQTLMDIAEPHLVRSNVVYNGVGNTLHPGRTSMQMLLQIGQHELVDRIRDRIHVILGVPLEAQLDENMQIVRYEQGQNFHCHHDPYPQLVNRTHVFDGSVYNRLVSFMIILQAPLEGGATRFCRYNLDYDPYEFSALFFYNLHAHNNRIDGGLQHAGMPVVGARAKWILIVWFHLERHSSVVGQALP